MKKFGALALAAGVTFAPVAVNSKGSTENPENIKNCVELAEIVHDIVVATLTKEGGGQDSGAAHRIAKASKEATLENCTAFLRETCDRVGNETSAAVRLSLMKLEFTTSGMAFAPDMHGNRAKRDCLDKYGLTPQ